MAIRMEPSGRFGTALAAVLNEKSMSLRDLAAKLDMTYEHMRKLMTNRSHPERLTLKEICHVTGLDFKKMEELVVQDKMDRDYGDARYTAVGRSPRVKQIEPLVSSLSDEQFRMVLAMLRGLSKASQHRNG
jgi:transcriptional regulator with XRE-family HTH domain